MFLSKRHTKARFCRAWQSIGGWIAQLVEQRTENPCVPSSILGLATIFIFYLTFLLVLINSLRKYHLVIDIRLKI